MEQSSLVQWLPKQQGTTLPNFQQSNDKKTQKRSAYPVALETETKGLC